MRGPWRARRLERPAREARVLAPLGSAPGYDLTDFVEARRREGASDGEIAGELPEACARG